MYLAKHPCVLPHTFGPSAGVPIVLVPAERRFAAASGLLARQLLEHRTADA
jgi:hypothetical protein